MINKEKSLVKRILSNQFILSIVGLIIIILISFPLAKNVSKQYKVNKEIESLKTEINGLQNKNSQLKNLISYIQSDQFIDESARKNLNYKKAGENVVIINNVETAEKKDDGLAVNNSQNETSAMIENNADKWVKYFFKH